MRLSARECEVAALIADGLTNAEIAERLALKLGTVGNHVVHILRALQARNRDQVALWAIEHGLRPLPGLATSAADQEGGGDTVSVGPARYP